MTDKSTLIREEVGPDAVAVYRVNLAAFDRPEEAGLVDALRRRGAFICSLVAELDGAIVGHILFTPATIETDGGAIVVAALGPLAVSPEYQKQGIGGRLVQAGLNRCREAGYRIVIVLGHPAYYPRFGFQPARPLGIRWEHEAPVEAFMVAELVPGALEGVRGIARYQPEFSLV